MRAGYVSRCCSSTSRAVVLASRAASTSPSDGRDDRPLHEDVPRPCERLGVAEAGLVGQSSRGRRGWSRDAGQASLAGRALRAHLEQHVDAASTPRRYRDRKPLVEEVEDGQQLALGGGIRRCDSATTQSITQRCSRISRNAITRSSLDEKCR